MHPDAKRRFIRGAALPIGLVDGASIEMKERLAEVNSADLTELLDRFTPRVVRDLLRMILIKRENCDIHGANFSPSPEVDEAWCYCIETKFARHLLLYNDFWGFFMRMEPLNTVHGIQQHIVRTEACDALMRVLFESDHDDNPPAYEPPSLGFPSMASSSSSVSASSSDDYPLITNCFMIFTFFSLIFCVGCAYGHYSLSKSHQ